MFEGSPFHCFGRALHAKIVGAFGSRAGGPRRRDAPARGRLDRSNAFVSNASQGFRDRNNFREETSEMSEQMMPKHGDFCWNELSTANLESAVSFYKTLLGWEIKEGDAPGGGMKYNEIVVGGRHVGGMYSTSEMCGGEGAQQQQTPHPPHWQSYVAVDDVDASASKAKELGGKVCV